MLALKINLKLVILVLINVYHNVYTDFVLAEENISIKNYKCWKNKFLINENIYGKNYARCVDSYPSRL